MMEHYKQCKNEKYRFATQFCFSTFLLIFQFQLFLLSLLTKKCSKRLFYLFCVPYCSSLKLLIFLLTVDSNGRCLEGFFYNFLETY